MTDTLEVLLEATTAEGQKAEKARA